MHMHANIYSMSKNDIEICLAHSIRRADRVLSQLYSEHLSEVGIRGTQFSLIRAINFMQPCTAAQLQDELVMDQTTVSRALKPLIRDGVVAVTEGETKREKSLSLTSEGRALYKSALVHWQKAQRKVREHLKDSGETELIAMARKLVELKG